MRHILLKNIPLLLIVFSISMDAAAQPDMIHGRGASAMREAAGAFSTAADSANHIVPFARPASGRPSFIIGIPVQISAQTHFSLGLSFEAGLTDFLHAEIQQSIGGSKSYGGNLPFQLRCKIYPKDSLGLFLGAGYVHGIGGGDQGNRPINIYRSYNGAEIFAGYMLPIICTCEAGYRFSPRAWGTRNNYGPDLFSHTIISTEDIFLREFYFSLRFDLVSW